ncbi:MAG TPA: hypothetical protein VKU41_26790, partial [Polyangiaceae bacterium]|nr:hypothetical protein [Polyangiaceae bacterium]
MRVPVLALVVAFALTSCGASQAGGGTDPVRYLDDAAFRRSELSLSLVNANNGYSQLRLEHYATGDANDWDRLEEWNPPVDPVAAGELDGPGGASTTSLAPTAAPLELPTAVASIDDPALIALGRAAFARYPVQAAPYFGVGLTSRADAARYGLWVHPQGGVGGLVRARMADGTGMLSLTCASCHESPGSGG